MINATTKKALTQNFRCGQCGEQWSAKRKPSKCTECGSAVVQVLPGAESKPVPRRDKDERFRRLVAELNRESCSPRLRSYAVSWLKAGSNGFTWSQQNPEHFEALQETLSGSSLLLHPAVDGCLLSVVYPSKTRSDRDHERRRVDRAFVDFLGESGIKLAQCAGCGSFFEKTSRRVKFCEKGGCATRVSSRTPKKRAHHKTHHDRLEWLGELLTEMAKDAGDNNEPWPLPEWDWIEEVQSASATEAAKIAVKHSALVKMNRNLPPAQRKRLSEVQRKHLKKITRRWIHDKLRNPGRGCGDGECERLVAKINEVLLPQERPSHGSIQAR